MPIMNDSTRRTLQKQAQSGCPVFYFYASEGYLARQAAAFVREILSAGLEEDPTVLEGPAPQIEQIIMAAGTISFFGTRRIVELPNLSPKDYSEKDFADLCDALSTAENAVFLITSTFAAARYGSGLELPKQAKKLVELCTKLGCAVEVKKPQENELRAMLCQRAADQGASLSDTVAGTLLDCCGADLALLENEVDKLCAFSGYQTVTAAMVAELGTLSLEADVFDMVRLITAKNATGACQKLHTLLQLQQEPILITAALIGSYTDMFRVKAGQMNRHGTGEVFKDFHYSGKSDFRLKKSLETANHYTMPQLEACIAILAELDSALKSQPMAEDILMETALCRLARTGSTR